MNNSPSPDTAVRGERAAPAIVRERAVSSRISSILAVGLMSALGLGTLVWYYASTVTRLSSARQSAQELVRHRAQGDVPLPSLGPIEPAPAPHAGVDPVDAAASAPAATGLPSVAMTGPPDLSIAAPAPSDAQAANYPLPPPKSTAQLRLERQLSGVAYASQAGADYPVAVSNAGPNAAGHGGAALDAASPGALESGNLAALLRPGVTAAVRAQVLPSMRLLLPKGAFIDCTLETAIDSTLPGMTTCITATDTFGIDGKVVLLERGTKLVGETRGQVQQGAARVFVIWDEARTPTGVVVPLASPGADELGRAGLPGEVNRHFWERFGAAILISVLDGAVQTAVQSSNNGNGAVIVNPATSEGVVTEVLKSTVSIPPTIQKSQGDRIQVMVARDLDFRTVYALRADTGGQ
jgi:type IV secretion system protein VirB10